jgi:peptidoglycan/xylan/chitin deacetylase (PgdA/CDA1 family)
MRFSRNLTSGELDLSRLSVRRVPLILMYHSVEAVAKDPNRLSVTPSRFSEQMAWLAKRGCRGVSIETLVGAMRAGRERGLIGITFDDGYVNVVENAVPELLRRGFTATIFVISGLLGKTNEWDGEPVWPLVSARQVREIAAAGMEIGSHSVTHVRLQSLSAELLNAEIHDSRAVLSELVGRPIRGFAYPFGSMDASVRQVVRDAGYEYACSVQTPMAAMGDMALPRFVVGQSDTSTRLAAKKIIFRGYTAAVGTRLGETAIQRLAKIV